MLTREHNDSDAPAALVSDVSGAPDDPSYSIRNADWDDSGAVPEGMTARSAAAGFSPIRYNKGRQHNLDVDPRTKLKIVNVPAERRVAFADLQDVVIHVFVDCLKMTSSDQYAERVLIVTDQTLFLCSKEGAVARCVMVDAIKALFVSHDNRALGMQIPSEYDILVKFVNSADRDKTIKVLRTVYRRLCHNRLPVETILKGKKFDPKEFKITKPANFRLSIIQQRTRQQLREALELFEQEEETMLEEIDMVQDEMEERHKAKMLDMQSQLELNLQKLKDTVRSVWENESKLNKLREDVNKGKKLIEQVDGAFGPDGELPLSKDAQIAELELIVARLNAAVYASSSELSRRGDPDNAMTYFQKDLQEQLYQPSWPGTEDVKDVTSLVKALQDKVVGIDNEIQEARRVLHEGRATERRIQYTEERIAFLRQQQRSATYMRNAAAVNPGIPAAASGGPGRKAAGEQSIGFLSDLPQEITVETMVSDPRTGLRFVEVPEVLKVYFQDLNDAVLHFFAVVRKPSKTGELVKRVVIISDSALYLCTPNGTIKRCIEVAVINEILLDRAFGIGIKCSSDYDVTFQCATGDHRQEIVNILQLIYRYLSQGKTIPVTEIPKHQRLEAFLKLSPPAGYTMQLTQFRTRQELVDAIRQRRDIALHNAPTTSTGAGPAAIPSDLGALSEEDYIRLRQDVAREMDSEWRQDATLVQLRNELDQLDKLVISATDECNLLKRRMDEHRCEDGLTLSAGSFPIAPGSGIMPSSGPGVFRPGADGLFFIKVDPESVDCHLEVHQVNFNRDFFFTGHSNGFVNVWDLHQKGRPLIRTLREHTGKVSGICCTEADLLTASHDSSIRLWDLSRGSVKYRLNGHRGAVNGVFMEANRIVSGGFDTLVHLWDKETGRQVSAYRGHKSQILGVKFEGDIIVSVEWGWALIWDMRSSKVVRTLRDDQGGISCFDFADGVLACGGCGGDLTVWDVSKSVGETISAHQDDILCVQLAGRNAITSSGDFKISMWDVQAMKSLGVFHETHPFEPHCLRMDGRLLLAGEGPTVKIWSK